MNGILMDGTTYKVRVVYNSLVRSFELRSGENEDYMISGRHERDLLGTGYAYKMAVEPDPAHPEDYDAFYEMEIAIRQLHGCPPFQDLFFLTFTGLYEDQVVQAAIRFRNRLRAQLQSQAFAGCPATLLGPAPCAVAKINYTYRYRLTLAAKNSKPLRLLLAQELCIFAKEKQNRGVNAYADVNSYD